MVVGSARLVGLPIGEVARRSGRTIATVRHWEALGLIAPPPRASGQRRYPESVLDEILVVELAQRAGFRLAEVAELLTTKSPGETPGASWQYLADRKRAELDELAAAIETTRKLLDHLITCHHGSLQECLAAAGRSHSDAVVSGA